MPKKGTSKKVYLAIILLVIIIAATVAIVYATQFSPKKTTATQVGVHVGDSFTYKLTGESVLGSLDAITPSSFYIFNETDYYKVTITGIDGTKVSLATVWALTNGTQMTGPQIIDISNGNTTDGRGFWALYPANLKVNDLISPKGFDGIIVNKTDTKTYTDSTRTRGFWQIENQFRDINDPTGNTMRDDYIGVYFDQQTGMLDTLTNIQFYNNPQYNLIITWQLISSSVWKV
jgi:hypothetical protein